ncbi:MAG: SDR family NAD(P)-dependent oxidoreductase [Deltaproteobacteria bacterium]|nr:SDR family NAD(P)-dependent oxidoreductase [Deltaproteobacteria bacterium]
MHLIRLLLPIITLLHRAVFRWTGGRIGQRLFGLRFLILEHVGRKSGARRKTPLLCVEHEGSFLVVGSNAGKDHDPAWWLNLQAQAEARVWIGGDPLPVTAHRASGEEAERLWPVLDAAFRWFEDYRTVTDREIPIVVLETRAADATGTFGGRVAVVTGAASGVGRAAAFALARRGCHLALVDVNEVALREVADRLAAPGRRVTLHVADVADPERMGCLPTEVLAEHGHVHILVNNAGVMLASSFAEATLPELQWLVGINAWGVLHGCHFFLPALQQEEQAYLVNVASASALMGFPGHVAYSGSKSLVRGLSEALHAELAGTNVHVASVYPGAIRTGLFAAARGADAATMQRHGDDPGLARLFRTPEQVAARIVHAIERRRVRVLAGWDAYAVEWAWRIWPSGIIRLAGWVAARSRAGGEGRTARIEHVEVVHRYDASVQEVWDAYTDHARWREWAGTPGSRLLCEGEKERNGVGAVRGFVGGVREEIRGFDPPKRMTYAVTAGMPMRNHAGEVCFEADGTGTKLTWRCEFECRIPGFGGALRRGVEVMFERALRGLERQRFPPKSV